MAELHNVIPLQAAKDSLVREMQARERIIQDVGGLLQLDESSLQREAETFGLLLGLNKSEARTLANSIVCTQTEMSALNSRVACELKEVGICDETISEVQNLNLKVSTMAAWLAAHDAVRCASYIAKEDIPWLH